MTTSATDPVKIYVSNQRGYIWDIRDIQTVRVQHHICGVLSGTLPQVGQQNVFLGIPLILLPEEVVVLVRNNLAVLIDDRKAHQRPTIEQASMYHQQRESAILAQRRHTRDFEEAKRVRMAEVYKDQIQRKREGKKKVVDAAKEDVDGDSFEIHVPDLRKDGTSGPPPSTVESSSTPSERSLDSIPYTIIIQASSNDLPWHDPSKAKYTDLESAQRDGVWEYPTNALQRARCRVFEDLWRKGNFMGGGLRFGGDFLVYPGDPLRYHSHFTLTVLSSPDSSIMPLDLVSYGRLATAVKKAHLLASWDEETERVEYFSLEWAAMG